MRGEPIYPTEGPKLLVLPFRMELIRSTAENLHQRLKILEERNVVQT
jgi:hypothetical protein